MRILALIFFYLTRIVAGLGGLVGLLGGIYLIYVDRQGPGSVSVVSPNYELQLETIYPGLILSVVSLLVLLLACLSRVEIDGDKITMRGGKKK